MYNSFSEAHEHDIGSWQGMGGCASGHSRKACATQEIAKAQSAISQLEIAKTRDNLAVTGTCPSRADHEHREKDLRHLPKVGLVIKPVTGVGKARRQRFL